MVSVSGCYSVREYWDTEYKGLEGKQGSSSYRFDCYMDVYQLHFGEALRSRLRPEQNDAILHLGCGRSALQVK